MSTHKNIDRVCILGLVLVLVLSALFVNGEALGIQHAERVMGYENRLFDNGKVHTIDIIMDDWDSFIDSCRNEEYSVCSLVIDGEAFKNVAIRGKGNTSLSSVSSMNSDRYSFKVEFDHYDSTKTYHGLDKLSLNNIIQDTTFMKDYLTYQLMASTGAAAPLCSYVYITVNGEVWGLYLAVEAVEDSFLQRNYGSDHGQLYKPDSMNFGGGRGNGKDFNMDDFMADRGNTNEANAQTGAQLIRPAGSGSTASGSKSSAQPSDRGQTGGDRSSGTNTPAGQWGNRGEGTQSSRPATGGEATDKAGGWGGQMPNMGDWSGQMPNMGDGGFMGGFMGMGGSDVLLQYTDDDPSSYSNIFSSAKTDITEADQTRLIRALKELSQGNAEDSVNIEQVIRYFVVHNFVVNGDSYTGSMIHNYYLYEENGKLEMLPWDYNLAFGTFQGGNANSAVNDPIDTPLSVTGSGRPIIDWIFASEEYTALYHQYFAEFLEQTDFAAIIDETAALIADYVKKDPSKFYSYENFEAGVAVMREFCLLREQSVQGQLDGTIPSTSAEQRNSSALVDASHLTLSNMGSMGGGMGMGGMGGRNDRPSSGSQQEGSQSGGENSQNQHRNSQFGGGNFPNIGDISGVFPSGDMSSTFPSGDISSMFPAGGNAGTFPSFGGAGTFPSGGNFGGNFGGNSGDTSDSSSGGNSNGSAGTFPDSGFQFPGMTVPGGQGSGTTPSTGTLPEGSSRPTGGGQTNRFPGAVSGNGTAAASPQALGTVGLYVLLLAAALIVVMAYKRRAH